MRSPDIKRGSGTYAIASRNVACRLLPVQCKTKDSSNVRKLTTRSPASFAEIGRRRVPLDPDFWGRAGITGVTLTAPTSMVAKISGAFIFYSPGERCTRTDVKFYIHLLRG